MNVYAYRAALICGDCGDQVRADLTEKGEAPEDPKDENTYDSDDFPKGPYSSDSNDSDSVQHCDMCGLFLEVALTKEGRETLYDTVVESLGEHSMSDSMRKWVDFYDVSLDELIAHCCKEADVEEDDKVVTVADLKDQSGPGAHAVLHCVDCGAEYSANKGDYFNLPEKHVFMCCEVPMILVVKSTTYTRA